MPKCKDRLDTVLEPLMYNGWVVGWLGGLGRWVVGRTKCCTGGVDGIN